MIHESREVERSKSREVVTVSAIQRVDFLYATLVPAACERRLQKRGDDAASGVGGCEAFAEREHVGVVVLAAQARGLLIAHGRRANARDLVRRHRHAETGTAKENAAVE